MIVEWEPGSASAVGWLHRACEAVVARLPFGLNSVVAPTFLGFVVINSGTFALDLVVLTLLHGVVHTPFGIAVTLAYACAFAASYVLNRVVNFQSHGEIGPQIAIYVVVVVINYLAFILGVSTALRALGLEYHLARMAAGACEGIYMYCAMRWVVFRR
ncbi:polysaccharide synthesis protein GtrA [Mycolicibacterium litorale]|nr:polysaccharide synthesis protein GtrA [Mycolicibacterium litorale]